MKSAFTQRLEDISKWNVGKSFGLPHEFTPDLSLKEALVASAIAFTRIFVGSVNFALWGVAIWMTYAAIANPLLRILAVLPLVILFAASMAALMLGISLLARWAQRKLAAMFRHRTT